MQGKESLQVGEVRTSEWQDPRHSSYKVWNTPIREEGKANIRQRAPCFNFNEAAGILYYRSYDGVLLRCLDKNEALAMQKEIHKGICGAHQLGPKLYNRIRRQGYYWPTMIRDTVEIF